MKGMNPRPFNRPTPAAETQDREPLTVARKRKRRSSYSDNNLFVIPQNLAVYTPLKPQSDIQEASRDSETSLKIRWRFVRHMRQQDASFEPHYSADSLSLMRFDYRFEF